MPDEMVKATFQIRRTARARLASLKAKLLDEGVDVTESGLMERLLAPDFINALEDDARRYPRARLRRRRRVS
jgi:hypothetical protein